MMRTDGTPLETAENHTTSPKKATCSATPTRSAAPPPSLRNPGEQLPTDEANAKNAVEGRMSA